MRSIIQEKLEKERSSLILNWVASNATKESFDKVLAEMKKLNGKPDSKQSEPSDDEVLRNWQELQSLFGGLN